MADDVGVRTTIEGGLPLTVLAGEGRGAAVVVFPSAFGVTPDLLGQLAEIAVDARAVIVVDVYFRDGAGPIRYDDTARVMGRVRGLDRAQASHDLRAAVAWTRAHAGGPVVALGVCLGGPFALLAAADGLVDGLVTWHATGLEGHLARAADARCPMHLHFGGADPFVPPSAVASVRQALAERADVRIFVHPGATHGFSHPGAPQAYDAAAERAGMASVRALVGRVGG